jgi:hypothetical protein
MFDQEEYNRGGALQFIKDLYAKMSDTIEVPEECPAKAHMGQIISEMEKVGVGAWLDGRH